MEVTPVFSSHSGDPRINIFFAGVILEPATEMATSPSTAVLGDVTVSVAGSSITHAKTVKKKAIRVLDLETSLVPSFLCDYPVTCRL